MSAVNNGLTRVSPFLIESFDNGVVAIIGGRFKGGDLRELRQPLATRGRAVVAIGDAAPLVSEAVADTVPVMTAESMREAVERAYEAARPDGVVVDQHPRGRATKAGGFGRTGWR